ncbi:probable disease resistance protein At1g12290 [Euphorbia lathyris]|uniref:probable disease resistance protein At1g12290 n=1 Tax=Euphorbia lathyris TaxID=212925 RepID=UPI003313F8B8
MSTVGLESTMMEVWRSVVHLRTAIIGVYGIGGVGKTTLLKQIYTKLTTPPLYFDTVIWVTVSQNLSVETVQDDIWKRIGVLNVEWVDKSFEEKAKAIFEVLSKKKLVLLLDDLGEELNLTEVGVPDPDPKDNKCKVIFTTRSEDVCHGMGAQTIEMVALQWEHAWELFKNKVGEDRLSDPKILDLAKTIASTCKGLPMLLCTVGRAMASMTTYDEWLGAIRGLQFQVADEGGKEYVFTLLQLCFDCLDSEVRSCLLYYCFFPEDFTILKNELIDFWICERLLGHYHIQENVLNMGYKTVDALIGASLLEEEQVYYVKLLDLVRDFGAERFLDDHVLEIASCRTVGRVLAMRTSIRNLRYYVPSNLFITFLLSHNPFIMLKAEFRPDHVSSQNENESTSTSTSGSGRGSGRLLARKLASSISKFAMRRKKKSTYKIEEAFNQSMTTISTQVIENLHQFIDSLTVLDLSNSGVEKVPREIAELVSLEYLNLSRTWIDHLPIEIKNLVKLKCLNLEYNDQLRVISKRLIFELSSLQVLKLFRCGYSVEEIEDNILSLTHMDIDSLFCLEHLKVLSITITCALALQKLLRNHKYLSCTQSLSLEVFWGCKSLDISPLQAMDNLLILEIHQFEGLNELNCYPHHFELERGRSFEKLREISLDKCSSLVEVTWLILVPNLAILKVQNCEEMEEVISSRRMGENRNEDKWEPFAKLEILRLENLPALKSIYWKTLAFQNLKKMEVIDCSVLKKLPLDSHSATANTNELLVIEAQEDWWENIEWEDDESRDTFLPCFKPTF